MGNIKLKLIKTSRFKIAIDIAMSLLLTIEMFYAFTGDVLHEVFGIAFYTTLITHIAFTSKWLKAAFGRKFKKARGVKQIARMVIIVLIFTSAAVLLFSSLMISNLLESVSITLSLGKVSYENWCRVHYFSAYALCAFSLVHLALHWVSAAHKLSIPYNPSRRNAIEQLATGVAALGALTIGVACVQNFETDNKTIAEVKNIKGDASRQDIKGFKRYDNQDLRNSTES